jgi:hypothetical protein
MTMENASLNQNQFQNLKQDLGPLLLGYCLNLDGKITNQTTIESLSLNQNQISVINELTDGIKQYRLHVINKGWSGDGLSFYILNTMETTLFSTDIE